jgi:hypothetical protein
MLGKHLVNRGLLAEEQLIRALGPQHSLHPSIGHARRRPGHAVATMGSRPADVLEDELNAYLEARDGAGDT